MLLFSAIVENFSPWIICRTQSLPRRMRKQRDIIMVMTKSLFRNSLFLEGMITNLSIRNTSNRDYPLKNVEEERGKKRGIERSGKDDVKKGVREGRGKMERRKEKKENHSL
jgi:hypothetical protein